MDQLGIHWQISACALNWSQKNLASLEMLLAGHGKIGLKIFHPTHIFSVAQLNPVPVANKNLQVLGLLQEIIDTHIYPIANEDANFGSNK